VPADDRLFYSSFDGHAWSGEGQMIGNSSTAPSLAVFNGRLFGAHVGEPGDVRWWYSHFDGNTWSAEHTGVGLSSAGPSLAAFNGRLIAAWKGVPGDTRMWTSSYPGTPPITASFITAGGSFVEVTGQGFTHDGTVAVEHQLESTGGSHTSGTDTVKTDDNGAFAFGIPLGTENWHLATVTVIDNDSLESVTTSTGA
jgi:hypothetical protein